jgi:hypothetical protein
MDSPILSFITEKVDVGVFSYFFMKLGERLARKCVLLQIFPFVLNSPFLSALRFRQDRN